jgi:hypothetical protein
MKQCTMNCGPAAGDMRSEEERRAECTDCVDLPDPVVRKCKGLNCTSTDGRNHSLECEAQHAAAIAGGVFVKQDYAALEMRVLAQAIDVAQPDKYLDGDEYTYTVAAMGHFGGNFAHYIARAGFVADSHNRRRLQDAFPDLFEKYGPKSAFYKKA